MHKENGGQLSARIAAVEKARGEYIVFLDSDDTLEDNALEAIAKAFSHYDVDFVIYDMQRVINGVVQPPKKLHETMILESKRDIFKFVLASNKYNSLFRLFCIYSIFRTRVLSAILSGGIAQLGERLPCKQEVRGSTPLVSTKSVRVIGSDPGER